MPTPFTAWSAVSTRSIDRSASPAARLSEPPRSPPSPLDAPPPPLPPDRLPWRSRKPRAGRVPPAPPAMPSRRLHSPSTSTCAPHPAPPPHGRSRTSAPARPAGSSPAPAPPSVRTAHGFGHSPALPATPADRPIAGPPAGIHPPGPHAIGADVPPRRGGTQPTQTPPS